jgi:hypothetical protein
MKFRNFIITNIGCTEQTIHCSRPGSGSESHQFWLEAVVPMYMLLINAHTKSRDPHTGTALRTIVLQEAKKNLKKMKERVYATRPLDLSSLHRHRLLVQAGC